MLNKAQCFLGHFPLTAQALLFFFFFPKPFHHSFSLWNITRGVRGRGVMTPVAMFSMVLGGLHFMSTHPHPQTQCCLSTLSLLEHGSGRTAIWSADTVSLPLCSISLSSEWFRHCCHSIRPCSSSCCWMVPCCQQATTPW